MRYGLIALLLAGCTHSVTLLPRHPGPQGVGKINEAHDLTVDLEGKSYTGKIQWGSTITTGVNTFGFMSTSRTSSDQASALLLGDGGQVRCDFVLDIVKSMGNGVCTDSRGRTYDMAIK